MEKQNLKPNEIKRPDDYNTGILFRPSSPPFAVRIDEAEYKTFEDGRVISRKTSFGWLDRYFIWNTHEEFKIYCNSIRHTDPENFPRDFPSR